MYEEKNEKIFFTKNKLAERWMLLTTRRPSFTTLGILAKFESSNTTWEAWTAALLPDAIAIEQSAFFIAKKLASRMFILSTVSWLQSPTPT